MQPRAGAGKPFDLRQALRLTVVTDRRMAEPRTLVEVVAASIRGGATAVQLRNKGDSARELLAVGRDLRALTHECGVLFMVNDRLDVALSLDADGVHVGPEDLPVADVRRLVPDPFIIGRSADQVEVARRAAAEGADYIGCGTVYGTTTKQDAGAVLGLPGLRRVVAGVAIPVVAIGGITAERAPAVFATGVAGIAVVGAVMGAGDGEEAAHTLLNGR